MNLRFQLTPQEHASFEGIPRPVSVRGPVALMRLVGRTATGRANDPFGRYWFSERYFWKLVDFLSDRYSELSLVNHYLKLLIREGTAVCYDWNTFAQIYQLRVPPGIELQAYVGRAKAQPFYSPKNPKEREPEAPDFFIGGDAQYIVDVESVGRRYVSGPIPMHIHGIGHA